MSSHVTPVASLYVTTSTIPNAGLGLFTSTIIVKDQIITQYEGERLSLQEYKERYPNGDAIYVFQLSKDVFIDARDVECFGRYANTKPAFSKCNAKFTKTGALKAVKKIKVNEEIFVYYGQDFVI